MQILQYFAKYKLQFAIYGNMSMYFCFVIIVLKANLSNDVSLLHLYTFYQKKDSTLIRRVIRSNKRTPQNVLPQLKCTCLPNESTVYVEIGDVVCEENKDISR